MTPRTEIFPPESMDKWIPDKWHPEQWFTLQNSAEPDGKQAKHTPTRLDDL